MDIENNAKPRTYKIIKDLMEEQDLIDAGGGRKKYPHGEGLTYQKVAVG